MGTDLEADIQRFVGEVTSIAGNGVTSIVLYGSAAVGEHVPGKSDLNFLIVARKIEMPLLQAFQTRMEGWSKRRIATPLLVEPDFLVRSTDSYPLEILGMIATKRVLVGGDPLQGLHPRAEDVRVQVEREAKGKELLLRRAFLESRGRMGPLLSYLWGIRSSIEAILRGILFTEGHDWRKLGEALFQEFETKVGGDLSALREIREMRRGGGKHDRAKVDGLYARTLDLITGLADRVDREGEDQ